ncbi:hypothetical protein QMK19_31060 [Streptomyces sp. H10-C2]|uniref:hypothetical protein n=1 Tax=unclassified Streptomyces TaxID=2593676 RepID=UPI0024B9EDC4|nr:MULTISPECIES: hypothetical protein [unclassified Streptomyces]MDJ0344956.1 hypothetical protein [Streptomyces sp. PH10-H1]MDJ0373963.1 hypothetical protein [Streptomyces sp. H10-C2]
MLISDAKLDALLLEFDAEGAYWGDSLNLEHLLVAAQASGLLSGLSIAQLLDSDSDCFLVLVDITGRITLSSAAIHWRDLRPAPDVSVAAAVSHILHSLAEVAAGLRADFQEEARLRSSRELR